MNTKEKVYYNNLLIIYLFIKKNLKIKSPESFLHHQILNMGIRIQSLIICFNSILLDLENSVIKRVVVKGKKNKITNMRVKSLVSKYLIKYS